MPMRRTFLLLTLLLPACAREEATKDLMAIRPDSASLARARSAADDLGRDLVGMLTAELQRGGPEGAIAICADSAQQRTARHAAAGVTVRRVGTRVRNPINAPDTTERAVLAAFAAAIESNRPMPDTSFVTADGAGAAYVRAIRMQPQCLACHGDPATFTPAVRRVLAERYPSDAATGYREGDLRGAISVRVTAGDPTPRP